MNTETKYGRTGELAQRATAETMDISDQRLFVVRPIDSRLAHAWPDSGGFEQSDDGPTYIVIGSKTTDDQCRNLARRFYRRKSRLDAGVLMAFRGNDRVSSIYADPAVGGGCFVSVGGPLYSKKCVAYAAHGKQRRTAWFSDGERAQRALDVVRRRYGNGIIYVD